MFGNVLGNCLYDKKFLKDIQKVKVVPVSFVLVLVLVLDIFKVHRANFGDLDRNRSARKTCGDGPNMTRRSRRLRRLDRRGLIR